MPRTCPECAVELREVERSGVRIDACPTCRGIWLDRGELERLLSAEAIRRDEDEEDFLREVGGRGRTAAPRKRRRGFLSDILDVD